MESVVVIGTAGVTGGGVAGFAEGGAVEAKGSKAPALFTNGFGVRLHQRLIMRRTVNLGSDALRTDERIGAEAGRERIGRGCEMTVAVSTWR
jgi:hypothetical protein